MTFLNRSTLTYPATNAFPGGIWQDDRNPTSADYRSFSIGTLWINFIAKTAWIMVERTATNGTWVQTSMAGTGILTITGDSGGAVGADGSNNINLLTGANLSIAGNAGTNTLTITLDGTVASTYTEDTGVAVPLLGNLNVRGANGIATVGAGSTITISAGSILATTYTADAGSATPSANNLNILGGTGCSTSGSGSTITINLDASVATTYNADTGSATPAANIINFVGTGSTTTSATGNTVTITSTGGGLAWSEITVVGPTQMVVDHGYITNSASRVQLLLPLTSAQGAEIDIVGKGSGGWQINQNAGQSITVISGTSTVGTGGMIQSSEAKSCVTMRCITANTTWAVQSAEGNIIIT